jgi:hypothetical protein
VHLEKQEHRIAQRQQSLELGHELLEQGHEVLEQDGLLCYRSWQVSRQAEKPGLKQDCF